MTPPGKTSSMLVVAIESSKIPPPDSSVDEDKISAADASELSAPSKALSSAPTRPPPLTAILLSTFKSPESP